jgi:hypothetical protein
MIITDPPAEPEQATTTETGAETAMHHGTATMTVTVTVSASQIETAIEIGMTGIGETAEIVEIEIATAREEAGMTAVVETPGLVMTVIKPRRQS